MATFYTTTCSVDQKLASLPDSLVHSNDTMMYLNQHSMMFDPPPSDATSYRHMKSTINDLVGSSVNGDPQNFQTQGLSLSLGTEMPFHYQFMNFGDGSYRSKEELMGTVKAESGNPLIHMGMYQYESADLADTILNSKYLKETQQMLDEVVNVQEALKVFDSRKRRNVLASGLDTSEEAGERSGNQSTEILPAELKDLQIKKTKLVSMIDEVDKRYRQYHHQMQVLVSSFDSIAGYGAAKPYTTLAQQAISRHFRSLHDAINGQIRAIKKSLGEQEAGIPRLRSVDRQIRQQRDLQHLGVMRHAWRPQRGLPESSVSTLRSWLFEHFLHPYPNDSEKITLARQTGLSRNQVANWFINARVRLWKPMVEEMYKEEFGDSELDSKSLENPSKEPRGSFSAYENGEEELQDITASTPTMASQSWFHKDNVTHCGPIRPMVDHSLLGATDTDDMAELNAFGFGDHVSLATARPDTLDYHYVDTGKQQHRFGSPHQLHDFVV